MLRWLKTKKRVLPTTEYRESSASDYLYGSYSTPSTANNLSHHTTLLGLTSSVKSSDNVYNYIGNRSSTTLPNTVTSFDDLIEHEFSKSLLSEVSFTHHPTCTSSDSGLDGRITSADDSASIKSSCYQPVSILPPVLIHAESAMNRPQSVQKQLTLDGFTASSIQKRKRVKKLRKIRTKASSILKVRRCKRMLSNHFISLSSNRPNFIGTELPTVHNIQRRRFESTNQFTRRRVALKNIEDNWFDSDDDSSVCSEDSLYRLMGISDFCEESMGQTPMVEPLQCNQESDTGRSSLQLSPSPSECLSSKTIPKEPEISEHEPPLFNPRIGFGLNRWYRPHSVY